MRGCVRDLPFGRSLSACHAGLQSRQQAVGREGIGVLWTEAVAQCLCRERSVLRSTRELPLLLQCLSAQQSSKAYVRAAPLVACNLPRGLERIGGERLRRSGVA